MKNVTLPIKNVVLRVWSFYMEGFKGMTLGKTLWLIILLKLFIMFCILKPLFFPRYLNEEKLRTDRAGYVADELIYRAATDSLVTK